MKISLHLEKDGQEIKIDLGFESLESINYSFRDIPENSEAFEFLSDHPSQSVRSNVASKKHLSTETLFKLALDESDDVRSSIAYNERFQKHATIDVIKEMLQKGGGAAENIVSYASSFTKVSIDEIEQVISELENPAPRLLQYVANSYDFSLEIIEKLSEHDDADIAASARESIKNRSDY